MWSVCFKALKSVNVTMFLVDKNAGYVSCDFACIEDVIRNVCMRIVAIQIRYVKSFVYFCVCCVFNSVLVCPKISSSQKSVCAVQKVFFMSNMDELGWNYFYFESFALQAKALKT